MLILSDILFSPFFYSKSSTAPNGALLIKNRLAYSNTFILICQLYIFRTCKTQISKTKTKHLLFFDAAYLLFSLAFHFLWGGYISFWKLILTFSRLFTKCRQRFTFYQCIEKRKISHKYSVSAFFISLHVRHGKIRHVCTLIQTTHKIF